MSTKDKNNILRKAPNMDGNCGLQVSRCNHKNLSIKESHKNQSDCRKLKIHNYYVKDAKIRN